MNEERTTPPSIATRLDELRDMQNGWLEGEGLAPGSTGLDWLEYASSGRFPDEALLPHIYPTPEGGIQMEWEQDDIVSSLEIDLETRHGEWFQFSRSTEECAERTLNLDAPRDWSWLISEIKKHSGLTYPHQPT